MSTVKPSYYQIRKEDIKMKRLRKSLETTEDPLKKQILLVKIKAQEIRVQEEAERFRVKSECDASSPSTASTAKMVAPTRSTGFTLDQQKKLLSALNRHESALEKLPLDSDDVDIVEKREILLLKIEDSKRKLKDLMGSLTQPSSSPDSSPDSPDSSDSRESESKSDSE